MFRVGVVLAALAVACSAGGAVVDRGEWKAGETCPDVVFIGARGTGQDTGIGPQLTDVYEQFVGLLDPGSDVEVSFYPLDYPAAGSRFGGASEYSGSVAEGVAALPAAVELVGEQCAGARIVLAGYSQGAHVIAIADHAFLEQANVDAIVLLANPVFAPGDPTEKVGQFDPEKGGIIREAWIDGPIAERTIQVCLKGDPVCQFGSLAFWVHSYGYAGQVLVPTAQFAADRVLAMLALRS
jgi:pimeloyl-ACP methyl ester carboxylesterase